jgi:hypothetical protein
LVSDVSDLKWLSAVRDELANAGMSDDEISTIMPKIREAEDYEVARKQHCSGASTRVVSQLIRRAVLAVMDTA